MEPLVSNVLLYNRQQHQSQKCSYKNVKEKPFPVYRLKLQIKTEDQIKASSVPFWNHPAKNAISELSKNRISQTAFIKFHILVLSQRLILRKCYFFLPFLQGWSSILFLFLTNNAFSRTASWRQTALCSAQPELRISVHLLFPRNHNPPTQPPQFSTLPKELRTNFWKWPLRSPRHWPLNKTSSGAVRLP